LSTFYTYRYSATLDSTHAYIKYSYCIIRTKMYNYIISCFRWVWSQGLLFGPRCAQTLFGVVSRWTRQQQDVRALLFQVHTGLLPRAQRYETFFWRARFDTCVSRNRLFTRLGRREWSRIEIQFDYEEFHE